MPMTYSTKNGKTLGELQSGDHGVGEGAKAYSRNTAAKGAGSHLVYSGRRDVSLGPRPQLVRVDLVRRNDAKLLPVIIWQTCCPTMTCLERTACLSGQKL